MLGNFNQSFWDNYWSRSYFHYEKHHQVFWDEIKKRVKGTTLDTGCGSGSCWKGFKREGFKLSGFDFSSSAIIEAKKNYPEGSFITVDFSTDYFNAETFDTIVISGVVNYYRDLTPIMDLVNRVSKDGTLVIITINVIEDFPDRKWDRKEIEKVFSQYGTIIEVIFFEKVGWLTTLKITSKL